ncbi:MAG: tetratricopeptide repeat protein [Bdellovibrionota bacterium]
MKEIQINSLALMIISLAATIGCKTTHNVKVDTAKRELALYSNDDRATAMPNPKNSDMLSDLREDLKKKSTDKSFDIKEALNLAQIDVMQDKLDEAEETVRKVLRHDLSNKRAKLILGNIFLRRKMFDMAKIIAVSLGGNTSKDSRVLNLLALIAIEEEDNSLAMSLFKEGLRLNPSDVAMRMNLGILYLKYRQINEASIQFERVLTVLPQHQDARLHLAAIWAHRGKVDAAQKVYEDILSEKENNPIALYNYAVLQSNAKEYDDAIDNLKLFIKKAKGKSQQTDKAFALINDIRQRMAIEGKQISNEEIEALAVDLEKKQSRTVATDQKKNNTASVENRAIESNTKVAKSVNEETEKKDNNKKTLSAKTIKNKVKKQAHSESKSTKSENIDDLEKMLLE